MKLLKSESSTFLSLILAFLTALLVHDGRCQFYETDDTFIASGQTNSFTTTSIYSLCFCDLTVGGCDPNCQCDKDCTDVSGLQSTYKFDYFGNQLSLVSNCYDKPSSKLYWVHQKPGLEVFFENDTTICVSVTSRISSDAIVAPTVGAVTPSSTATDTSTTISQLVTATIPGYQLNDLIMTNSSLCRNLRFNH